MEGIERGDKLLRPFERPIRRLKEEAKQEELENLNQTTCSQNGECREKRSCESKPRRRGHCFDWWGYGKKSQNN